MALLEILNSSGSYVDVSSYIELKKFQVSRNDIDSARSTRSALNGNMYRSRIAVKKKITVGCTKLKTSDTQILLSLLAPETITINYLDPELGWRQGVVVYSNNISAAAAFDDGTNVWWTDISFPLIEC